MHKKLQHLKHDQTIPPYIRTLHKPLQPLSNLIFSPVAHFTPNHPRFPHNISNPLKIRFASSPVNFVGTLLTLPFFTHKKTLDNLSKVQCFQGFQPVVATRFELATSASRTQRSTKLSHATKQSVLSSYVSIIMDFTKKSSAFSFLFKIFMKS